MHGRCQFQYGKIGTQEKGLGPITHKGENTKKKLPTKGELTGIPRTLTPKSCISWTFTILANYGAEWIYMTLQQSKFHDFCIDSDILSVPRHRALGPGGCWELADFP